MACLLGFSLRLGSCWLTRDGGTMGMIIGHGGVVWTKKVAVGNSVAWKDRNVDSTEAFFEVISSQILMFAARTYGISILNIRIA